MQNDPGAVHIYSRILDTEIWVVPDGWTGELDGPVYTDSEIRELERLQVTAKELRVIHRAKIGLDGDVMRPTEIDNIIAESHLLGRH